MRLVYALLTLSLLGFSCTPAAPQKPQIAPGRYVKVIKEAGIDRSYILIVPKAYDNKTDLPIVVLLHGWTSNADEIEQGTGFAAKADKEGFILAVPNGTEGVGQLRGWNCGFLDLGGPKVDDVRFLTDLIDQSEKDLYVDPSRVYVVGHSNGAMMAYDLAGKDSDKIAAIGIVSGTIGTADTRIDPPKSPVSAIIFHGKLDPTVAYDQTCKALFQGVSAPDSAKWWAEKDGCGQPADTNSDGGNATVRDFKASNGSEVELVTITAGDHSWPKSPSLKATEMIWDFLRSHPKRPS